ncbi:putative beta-barrel porin [Neolewinella xylanilytica]|uniref:Putative beta-barrel porin n=1 Tax=Neolewinella xylanilytica TaxID=1514080 RepID=A0A2S6IA74_9BACT|nr:putative porin [Neolewinella xylanilytica]PPK88401.1 putative beta-barrel porin [Neolewinella xylanilytica]
MVRRRYRIGLLLVLMCGAGLRAQIVDPSETIELDPDDPDYDASSARQGAPQQQRVIEPDTFGIYLYGADNPNREQSFSDSLLSGFQQYEPDRRVPFDYATLGQIGSAAYRMRYEPEYRRGLEIGLRQFDLYRLNVDNLDFYRLERPFTYLRYLRGSEQQDGMLEARFSRNFADGVNLLLGYDRIFQLGEQDQYPGTAIRNTNVTVGLSVRPPGSRYSGYFSYTANTFENRQNGGIAEYQEDDIGEIDNPGVLTPFLAETRIRHAYRQVAATQYLQFGAATDTLTGRERRAFTLKHQLRIERQFFRMTSIRTVTDTSFYARYPALDLDFRGLRSQVTDNIISNEIGFSTFRRSRSASQETVQRDLLELGLTHQYHRVGRETGDSSLHFVLATGRVGLRPSDRINLLVDGQLNLIGQVGDYRVAARGELDLGVAGKLEVGAVNQLYAPDLIQRTYLLNGGTYYDRDFGKTLELRVEGAYTLPFLGIRAGLAYTVLTNYIYRDTEGIPQQSDGPNSILQLTAERNFSFGAYRIDNRILLQEADQSVFRLPRLYGEHSLYFAGKWFGVLNVNLGADVRYASGFVPQYYNPILQAFHLQDRQAVPFAFQVDPFFSLRVTRFRFFVKYIQAQTLLTGDYLFLTAEHPYPDGALRLGVSWRLLD